MLSVSRIITPILLPPKFSPIFFNNLASGSSSGKDLKISASIFRLLISFPKKRVPIKTNEMISHFLAIIPLDNFTKFKSFFFEVNYSDVFNC